jgi:hypothetical protein
MRVSTRTPSRVNSFHAVVPTGYFQKSMFDVSMCSPFGRWSQRRFVAPSDQST